MPKQEQRTEQNPVPPLADKKTIDFLHNLALVVTVDNEGRITNVEKQEDVPKPDTTDTP